MKSDSKTFRPPTYWSWLIPFSRLAVAPQELEFLHNGMHIIGLLAILPYFMYMETKNVAIHSRDEQPVFISNQNYVEEGLFDEEEDKECTTGLIFLAFHIEQYFKKN